jgi:hypothetical protein
VCSICQGVWKFLIIREMKKENLEEEKKENKTKKENEKKKPYPPNYTLNRNDSSLCIVSIPLFILCKKNIIHCCQPYSTFEIERVEKSL